MSRNEFAAHVKRTQVHLLLLLAGWLAAGSSLAQTTVEYIHTDALGSVVAVTNEAGQVIERFDYEPYGAIIGQPNYGGVGFTGHVQDAATGLTYMQQRYYDPICGCFLSVDPVTAYDTGDWRHFNRYAYAFNNPYRFIDPDGRTAFTWEDAGKLIGKRAATAGITSAADGPLPVGEVVGAGILIYTVGEIGYKIYQANTSDTAASAGDKLKDGAVPAQGASGKKGELEGSGGQAGANGKFDSVDGTNERSPREGVRIKDLEGGGRIETHGATKNPDYPQGTPTVKVQGADGKPITTVRFPESQK
ncbi:MAG TPA: RHS repeat-associated core domain-containing protein [Pseudoxanthomonas sp.]|nr:RHS repeat-associated core domain-containing protein [Pseudoxanthomonas sp.]